VCCFAYLAFYALRAQSILKRKGIDYDVPASGGH
jgi:MFS transporter, FHS family, L-fucose permease